MGSDTLAAWSARAPHRITRVTEREATLQIARAQLGDMTSGVAPREDLAGVTRSCSRGSRFRAHDSAGRQARVNPSSLPRARAHLA